MNTFAGDLLSLPIASAHPLAPEENSRMKARIWKTAVRHFTAVSWPPGPLFALALLLRSNVLTMVRSTVRNRQRAPATIDADPVAEI